MVERFSSPDDFMLDYEYHMLNEYEDYLALFCTCDTDEDCMHLTYEDFVYRRCRDMADEMACYADSSYRKLKNAT